MAIVYRSKRELKFTQPPVSSLGPGSYDANYSLIAKNIQVAKILEPHQSKSKIKTIDKQFENKAINTIENKQNMVIVNQDEQLYVTQLQQKGIMQRSKTKRPQLTNQKPIPGPGTYNIESNILKPIVKFEGPKLQKSHILEQIFRCPYYQASVTILDLQQQNKQKQKLKKPTFKHVPLTKQPGYSISKNQRFKQSQFVLNQNPGPGSYQLTTAKNTKKKQLRNYGELDKHLSRITQDTSHMSDSSQDSIQYVKQSLPGPGSYNIRNQSNLQPSFNKCFTKFGSTQQRFKQEKQDLKAIPYYQYPRSVKSAGKKGIVFGRSKSSRFLERVNKTTDPGPGYYNDPRTTVNKIEEKYIKGYEGNFGSNAIRFKPFKAPYEGRTDFYISPSDEKDDGQQYPLTWAFASKTSQGQSHFIRKDYITQNYYSQDFYSIKHRLQQQSIKQTQKVVLQPCFGSGAVRFNYKIKQYQQQDEQQLGVIDIPFQKNEFTKGHTFSKSKIQTKFSSNPGPGAYVSEDDWNKKSHNILFIQ